MNKVKEELQKIGFYEKFSVVNTVNVWSDGKTMRRYQGQDKINVGGSGNKRKLVAILIEVED